MTPANLISALPALFASGVVPMIYGPPGVGKSDVVAQVAKNLGYDLLDVRLTLYDPVDLKGFPDKDTETGQMRFLPPSFLPPMKIKGRPNKTRGILFLDELTSAERSMQAAAYQLILNRAIGDTYTLPAGWHIVAAGNRAQDRALVNAMPSALANRFIHIDFEVSHRDFCDWAIAHDISTVLLAFLRFRPHLLHDFKPTENPRAFPTPRSWMFVNKLLQQALPPALEHELLAGAVGQGAATELLAFMQVYRDLPDLDAVLANPATAVVPAAHTSVMFALATALSTKVTPALMAPAMQYVSRWAPEFQVLFLRDAARRDRTIGSTPAFVQWVLKYGDLLNSSSSSF